MAFTPHTEKDVKDMLAEIGCPSLDDLFSDVPEELLLDEPVDLPSHSEFEVTRFFEEASTRNRAVPPGKLFLGAGAYAHYIPAAVKALVQRGEFLTSYTPYQAEVSQGTLQAIFEFQSHICSLTGLEVANASMYDGATALAEALLMAIRHTRRSVVYLPEALHPHYRAVCETFMREIDAEIRYLPMQEGHTLFEGTDEAAAVVIQTPNFFGLLEDPVPARELADRTKALLIAVCNPMALAILCPPGDFGADIAVGEAQPLGIPLQYGGPYAGYFACRKQLIRKMPGRIAGTTTDEQGNDGYVLTLQTREQHIRREKATSNICTNQGLFALMVTMYLTFVGREGLVEVAETCLARAHTLAGTLARETEIELSYGDAPFFHEFAIRLPVTASDFLERMRHDHGIEAGFDLGRVDPARRHELLVCATELMTERDLEAYAEAAKTSLKTLLVKK